MLDVSAATLGFALPGICESPGRLQKSGISGDPT